MEIITFFQEVDRPDRALVSISTYGNHTNAYKYTTWYMFVLHVYTMYTYYIFQKHTHLKGICTVFFLWVLLWIDSICPSG